MFIFHKSNFATNAFLLNLRLAKRTIVFLGIVLTSLWQSSISDGSILIFKHLKISIPLFSNCSSLTVAGIPCISMLLHHGYWSLLFFATSILRILSSSCCTLEFKFHVFFFNCINNAIRNAHYTFVNYISNIFLDITLYLIQSTINIVEFLVSAIFQTWQRRFKVIFKIYKVVFHASKSCIMWFTWCHFQIFQIIHQKPN